MDVQDVASVSDAGVAGTDAPVSQDGLPPGYVRNADGSITATLAYPPDGGPAQVTLNRLKGRAMVDVMNAKREGDRVQALVLAAVGMAGPKGTAFFNGLDGYDIVQLGEAAASFLPSGQTTGQ
ncbi:hypothetical protein AA0472_1120 [Acetobacter estunensis NRIC 0472]|nr:hypothetical protein AA0472_1120 [Acetobacter estunensis NRIC 0472]